MGSTEWNTILPDEQSSAPVDIAVDSSGAVFIVDGRVKIFAPNGVLQDFIEVLWHSFLMWNLRAMTLCTWASRSLLLAVCSIPTSSSGG